MNKVINPERQLKKKAMRELNLTGKQYRKLLNAVKRLQIKNYTGGKNGHDKGSSPERNSPEPERNSKDTQ
jgi:hypothetical protein